MLVRFGVENFRSFRDRAELCFDATRLQDAPSHRFPAPGTKHGVLPVVALYGANASGKSNLLAALRVMHTEVAESFRRRMPGAALPYEPFKLGAKQETTTLDAEVIVDGVQFVYGFRFDAAQVYEEWLYAYPENARQVWFHRKVDETDPYYFGPKLLGQKRFVAGLTRPNSLFLSAAAQHNQQQLTPIYQAFASNIEFPETLSVGAGWPTFSASAPLLRPTARPLVTRLLEAADLGVTDFRTRTVVTGDAEQFEVELAHRSAGQGPVFLRPEEESRGTHTLLRHINAILTALKRGSTLVIDELDASMHPRLSAALVELFTSPDSNPHGAQLLCSTHDESLMEHLRRDSIILVEKDRTGASTLVGLAEFKTRGRDNIRRAYSRGQFGGTPALGDLPSEFARDQAS